MGSKKGMLFYIYPNIVGCGKKTGCGAIWDENRWFKAVVLNRRVATR